MIEGLQISIPRRMVLLRVTLILSMAVSMLLSFRLWGAERYFPMSPLIASEQIPAYVNALAAIVFMILLLASLFLKMQRTLLFLAFCCGVFLVLLDVNRLQHWFYIYNAMLLVFIVYNGRVDDPNKYTSFFIILQSILASVYFFSGFHQLNSLFIETDYSTVISPLKHLVSQRQFRFFQNMGVFVPYFLMFTGLGLIISPLRYLAITLATVMHLLLIIFLFPAGINANATLWFSNISFLVMVFLLFSGKTKQRYFSPSFLFQRPLFYVMMVLFVVMPFFNVSGRWPDFLSSNIRTGNNQTAVISFNKKVYEDLPLYVKSFCQGGDMGYVINYRQWCNHELGADCFPSEPVFRSIDTFVATQGGGNQATELVLRPRVRVLFKR
jgi:hypothetical protein